VMATEKLVRVVLQFRMKRCQLLRDFEKKFDLVLKLLVLSMWKGISMHNTCEGSTRTYIIICTNYNRFVS
jgi:hypothetical protein